MERMKAICVLLAALSAPCAWSAEQFLVYIGTYTRQKSKGIYVYRFDAGSGKLDPIGLAAETANPSFLAVHPSRKFLYAVGEMYGPQKGGAVSAFRIDAGTGQLTLLNSVSTRGAGPCHLMVDKTGKCLVAVNYGSGSVASFPVKEDGSLGEASGFVQHAGSSVDPKRQQGPHAHSVNVSPDNRFAVVADLGLDQVLVYRLDPAKAMIEANDPPFVKVNPGAGPRHFTFHPGGKFAYVINEIKSTVTAFSWEAARGAFKEIETVSTLPQDFTGVNHTAEVQAHPSGRFLYGSNRGHNSIAVFAIDTRKGTLTPVERVPTQGKTPRNFGIDPTGSWLIAAHQDSDSLVVFRIDKKTGKLTPTGQQLEVGAPVCVKFLPLK